MNPGDIVWWYATSKPSGWHAGRYVRTITRGPDKDNAVVETGGGLLPRRTFRIAADRLRLKAGS